MVTYGTLLCAFGGLFFGTGLGLRTPGAVLGGLVLLILGLYIL